MTNTLTMKLARPIEAHGETVSELRFRPLTAREMMRHGAPFNTDKLGSPAPDFGVIGKYVVDLASIPASAVEGLSAVDFMKATEVIVGFFAPPPEVETPAASSGSMTSSTPTSTTPSFGASMPASLS